jgi:hypothetical protein
VRFAWPFRDKSLQPRVLFMELLLAWGEQWRLSVCLREKHQERRGLAGVSSLADLGGAVQLLCLPAASSSSAHLGGAVEVLCLPAASSSSAHLGGAVQLLCLPAASSSSAHLGGAVQVLCLPAASSSSAHLGGAMQLLCLPAASSSSAHLGGAVQVPDEDEDVGAPADEGGVMGDMMGDMMGTCNQDVGVPRDDVRAWGGVIATHGT